MTQSDFPVRASQVNIDWFDMIAWRLVLIPFLAGRVQRRRPGLRKTTEQANKSERVD
jgi:hypothetical protein